MHVLVQEQRTAAQMDAVFVVVHVCAVLELCSAVQRQALLAKQIYVQLK